MLRYQKQSMIKLSWAGEPVTKTKNKALSKKGEVVWRYKRKVNKESNWLTYCGSNKELEAFIKSTGYARREILCFCYTNQELTYMETKYQFQNNVLESDRFYNDNILGKFFRGITK
jgi:hypothetical protein